MDSTRTETNQGNTGGQNGGQGTVAGASSQSSTKAGGTPKRQGTATNTVTLTFADENERREADAAATFLGHATLEEFVHDAVMERTKGELEIFKQMRESVQTPGGLKKK